MCPLIHSAYYSDKITQTTVNHYHDCHQIIFVVSGQAEIKINGQKHIAQSGDLAIISRLENHSVTILSKEYKRYILRINPLEINYDNKGYALFLNRPLGFKNILNVSEQIEEYQFLFNHIIAEFYSDNKFKFEMQENLLSQLLILIAREIYDVIPELSGSKFNVIADLQKKFMTECFKEYTLEDLAQEYHLSVSTLSHQFKKITGFSIYEYLQSCRIALAKHYLTQTDISITEVVENCGFSDNSNFSRLFKSYTNMTPSQFRHHYSI